MNPGRDSWLGILGGGQLGRMMALDARRMGVRVLTWTGGDISGAARTADRVFEESFDDPGALERFIERADVVTVEFENIPRTLLENIERVLPTRPGPRALSICQHRAREKQFLSQNGFPCARFEIVDSNHALVAAMDRMEGLAILKTAEFGYDGKGQSVVQPGQSPDALREHWTRSGFGRAVLEEKVDLALEFSLIVSRFPNGEVRCFDACENQHRHHILDVSIAPVVLPDGMERQAREIAIGIAVELDYHGVLAVEFFVSRDGRLLVNELAPRPHNSGHHTIDACLTSQFEQHVRAVMGLPPGSTELLRPAVMWNLLGDLWKSPQEPPDWSPVLTVEGASLHLYGKSEARAWAQNGPRDIRRPND